MSVDAHVTELKRKHAALSEEVERKQASAATSSLEIKKLKAEKLRLKDEIEQLSA